jgi:glycosyltransferase involved in cell wall biosynthesis
VKVVLSAPGRFHAFDLARELHQRGALARLITNRPLRELGRYHVPLELARSRELPRIVNGVWQRLPGWLRRSWNPQYYWHISHDRFASRCLPESADVFVGWAGASLDTLREARRRGMRVICERGSAHILEQIRILEEEYASVGLRFCESDPRTVERELREYEEADCIAVPSRFVKNSFLARGCPESKLIHVPYGFEPHWFVPQPRGRGPFRVVHCGALSLRKGVQYLLRAFSELKLPDAELWLIGRPQPEIRPFLARYASDRIVLRGYFPRHELAQQYSQASVFCLASVEEGLAMVILEAMACGLPAIVSENTGGGDVVESGREGWIVPVRDVEALKDRLLWCYEHRDEAAQMGVRAREKVVQSFTWGHYGTAIFAEYQRMCGLRTAAKVAGPSPVRK